MKIEFKELDILTDTYSQEIRNILSEISAEEMRKPKKLEAKLILECNIRTNKLNNFIHETYPLSNLDPSVATASDYASNALNALAQDHLGKRYDEFELLCKDWFRENLPDYYAE